MTHHYSPRNLLLIVAAIAWLPRLEAQSPSNSSRKMTMVNVDGHSMRVQTANLAERKPSQPIVVLESGAVSPLENWDPVFDQIAALAPVVAYDRRGIGQSEYDGQPPTLKHVTTSLHALLVQLKAAAPYVLVGHSYGAIVIREFAKDFPTEVKGLVYLDAPDVEMTYAEMDAISPKARNVVFGDFDDIPPNLPAGMRAEIDNIHLLMANDMAEARAVLPPARIPASVLVAAGKYERSENPPPAEIAAGLLQLQIKHEQQWALASPHGLFMVVRDSSHYVHRDQPSLVVRLIQDAVGAVAPSK